MEAPLLVMPRRPYRPAQTWRDVPAVESGVQSFPVGNPREYTPLGWKIIERMTVLGIDYQKQVAELAGVAGSSVTRALYGPGKLDPDTIRDLAVALKADYNEWMIIGGYGAESPEATANETTDPEPFRDELLEEARAILDPAGRVSDADREKFRNGLDLLVSGLRPQLKRRSRRAA